MDTALEKINQAKLAIETFPLVKAVYYVDDLDLRVFMDLVSILRIKFECPKVGQRFYTATMVMSENAVIIIESNNRI